MNNNELVRTLLMVFAVALGILVVCFLIKDHIPRGSEGFGDNSGCPAIKPASSYEQGSGNCGGNSPNFKGIVTPAGVLNTPGDWLVVMKPGFTAPCLKCCVHQVTYQQPGSSKGPHKTCENFSDFDGCKYTGGNYHYGWISSATSAKGQNSLEWNNTGGLCDPDSPVVATVMSCGPNNGYIAWNDQNFIKPGFEFDSDDKGATAYRCQAEGSKEHFTPPDGLGQCRINNCDNLDAHDKGFILFNDKIAVLCTHSCPGFPMGTGGNPPSCFSSEFIANMWQATMGGSGGLATGPGQSFAFTVMSAQDMERIMPTAWTIEQCSFQDAYIPKALETLYPATTKLLKTVFMQVPIIPLTNGSGLKGVECAGAEDKSLCKYTSAGKYIKSPEDCHGTKSGYCGNLCSWSTSFGHSSCKVNSQSCKGLSDSFTVWTNLGDRNPDFNGVQVFPVTNSVQILSKSGYFLNGGSDIWADVIAPVVQSNVIGTTWDQQYGACYGGNPKNSAGGKYSGIDFSGLTGSRHKSVGCGATQPFESDHSKMAIATSNNWCAIGGLNRAPNDEAPVSPMNPYKGSCTQCCRGTLFTLINDANLHNALREWLGLSVEQVTGFQGCRGLKSPRSSSMFV